MTTLNQLAHDGPIDLELFPCAGGLAMGFKRAGINFHVAIEWMKNHCDSYEQNVGHRPIQMDVHDFLRMCELGFRFKHGVRFLCADPPCVSWSRAGKREGLADERDMLEPTCKIIRLLKPQAYLIGNVPGLDDGPNLHVTQKLIGSLCNIGYCTADYVRLDAAAYGVPQHRIRPWWFGHLAGPCIQWPAPTHGDPKLLKDQLTLPGVTPLLPWVTCGQALAHLSPEEVGRPVRLRWRSQNSDQHGSVREKPARVVGTSNLSDGNVLVEGATPWKKRKKKIDHRPTDNGCLFVNTKHAPAVASAPSPTLGAKSRGQSAEVITDDGEGWDIWRSDTSKHPAVDHDAPAGTIRSGGNPDKPGATMTSKESRVGAGEAQVLEWPWDRPATTVQRDERLGPPGHHDEYSIMSDANAVVISEKAAAILQGFPESAVFVGKTKKERWSQIGQAMPAPLAHAVANQVAEQFAKTAAEQEEQRQHALTPAAFDPRAHVNGHAHGHIEMCGCESEPHTCVEGA